MKKLLLTLLTVVCAVSSSWADEEIIYSTGFESSEGFTASTTYNNTTEAPFGNYGKQWKTYYGCVSSNAKISGSQALQMRVYSSMSAAPYAYTDFSVAKTDYKITKITFSAKTDGTSNCKGFKLQLSTDGGSNWTDAKSMALTSTNQHDFEYTSASGITASDVRLKVVLYDYVATSSSSKKFYFDDVKVYGVYTGAIVNVTNVSLNKTATSISVGESETLSATITPANATNKHITWSTSDANVATVADGVVKAKSVGTATITVTTEDGNYSANCVVTVTPELPYAGILYSWDGSHNSSNSSANETGGTATAQGGNQNTVVGKASKLNWCLSLGKGYESGTNYIKITLDRALKAGDIITTGCFVTGDSKPTNDLVYGINFTGENEVTLTYDGDGEGVSEIPYISTNTAPTDQAPIIVPAAAEGKNEIWIYRKSGATTLYVSKFIVTRPVGTVTVTGAKYATYYNEDFDYTMPEGLTGYAFFENALEKAYEEGDVVPAGEPLVLGGVAGNYTLFVGETSSTSWKEDNMNDLCGAATDITAAEMEAANPSMGKFYALSLNSESELSSVGFYWINEDGAAFDLEAGKAYLALPADAQARAFVFADESTGIQSVQQNAQNGVAYNLAGQRVTANAKGIVIMNGKKYLNK